MAECHARTEPMGAVFGMLTKLSLPSAASHGTCQPGQVSAKMMTRTRGEQCARDLGGENGLGETKIYLGGRGPPWQRQGLFLPSRPAQNSHSCPARLARVLGGLCRCRARPPAALAALTGTLSFAHAKPGIVRAWITQRVDPVLFEMSYDSVGDLSETVALMWPRPVSASPSQTPSLSEVVTTLAVLGKLDLPAQLAQWLDGLDETGRWAMLKLVTGALRIGVSARLAKTAVAVLGNKDPNQVELDLAEPGAPLS
jgi:hypothetical protein